MSSISRCVSTSGGMSLDVSTCGGDGGGGDSILGPASNIVSRFLPCWQCKSPLSADSNSLVSLVRVKSRSCILKKNKRIGIVFS
jgi:hypothetical protein